MYCIVLYDIIVRRKRECGRGDVKMGVEEFYRIVSYCIVLYRMYVARRIIGGERWNIWEKGEEDDDDDDVEGYVCKREGGVVEGRYVALLLMLVLRFSTTAWLVRRGGERRR